MSKFGDVGHKKEGTTFFITDFGSVAIGPQWESFIKDSTKGLDKDKRSRAYKEAKKRNEDIYTAICVLSEFEWSRDRLLEKLP